jgi:hypothetical protein
MHREPVFISTASLVEIEAAPIRRSDRRERTSAEDNFSAVHAAGLVLSFSSRRFPNKTFEVARKPMAHSVFLKSHCNRTGVELRETNRSSTLVNPRAPA